jgi:5S rRNA maturation endonuclease (ribonuclease M5)
MAIVTTEEFEEELKKFVEKATEQIVIVEGIEDKKALVSLGITNIITLRKPIFYVVEAVVKSSKECVILTDLDSEGKKLFHRLYHELGQFGVKIDNRFREFLFRTKLRQIEGIVKYRERIE